MGKDYGEPIRYDPDFNGPTRNRSCTDIIWLIVFILFLGGWGYVGYYGMTRGSVEKLLSPIDSKGRRCGVDSGLEDKKYLVFFNIAKCLQPGSAVTGCPTPQVCVPKCPDRTIIFPKELSQNPSSLEQLRQHLVCTDDVNIQTLTLSDALKYIDEEKCASYVVQSKPVLFRCVGDPTTLGCDKSRTWLKDSGTCAGNAEVTRKSMDDFVNAFDSYVGWVTTSFISIFTRNEKDAKIVGSNGMKLAAARTALTRMCIR